MALQIINQCLQLLGAVCVSSVWSVLVLMQLTFILLTKGPKKMFARTVRNTEPEALTDPKYGTHGYLHLEVSFFFTVALLIVEYYCLIIFTV